MLELGANNKLKGLLGISYFYETEINEEITKILEDIGDPGDEEPSEQKITCQLYGRFFENIVDEIKFLHVYCDGIIDAFVNNSKSNILRIVPYPLPSKENYIQYSFEKNLFIPLKYNELNFLNVSIKDHKGNNLFSPDNNLLATILMRPLRNF